jgi:hypothetical protein
MPLGRRFPYRERRVPRLSLTAKKSFAVPWGYENILASGFIGRGGGDEEQVSAGEDLNFASILLSGLSFFCSIAW